MVNCILTLLFSLLLVLPSVVLLATRSIVAQSPQSNEESYQKVVSPFLRQYCLKCHGAVKPKGDFRVDEAGLPNDFADLSTAGKWREVVNVLNSHEMPPKQQKQPAAAETARVVDWITGQLATAELARRDKGVVLRRLNRSEYRNTIRDLVGIDFDTSIFPQDTPAGGFDNNGKALTMSSLMMELYLNAAQKIVNQALVSGSRPATVKWRFEPKVGPLDERRIKIGEHHAILNGGNNKMEGNYVVIHHNVPLNHWEKSINAPGFCVPVEGTYAIRIHVAGRVPKRERVISSAKAILQKRLDQQVKEEPQSKDFHKEIFEQELKHFETDRMYDYGPPRIKLVLQLGPQPHTIAEFDVDAAVDRPKVYEFHARFTTEPAGIVIDYAYDIPRVLENFWLQEREEFARPELLVDWFEIEGPIYPTWPPPSHTNILFDSPLRDKDERAYAHQVLARFMRKAYRRLVTREEIDTKLALFNKARKQKDNFVEAIKTALVAVLISPHFLYLAEPSDTPSRALNDHELAARMSYFLWSSMADEELFKLADAGKLKDTDIRRRQVDRMLADPKAEAFVRNFVGQWLGL